MLLVRPVPLRKARFVDEVPDDAFWRTLHRLADAAYPALRREILAAFQALAQQVPRAELAALVAAQHTEAVLAVLDDALGTVATTLRTGVVGTLLEQVALDAAARTPAVGLATRFNVHDPEALQSIRQRIGDRITAISDTTRQSVRGILQRAFESGTPLVQQITAIAETVGLTPRQAASVARYQEGLRQSDTPPAQQTALVHRRIEALKRQRAEVIARTEGIDAAISGQEERWNQMARNGFLDVTTARRFFVVTPDDRLCLICRQVPGLNAQGVGLRQEFQTPIGARHAPPIHVQCRCAVNLVP